MLASLVKLAKELEGVDKQIAALTKKREAIMAKAHKIQSKCRHPERKQRQGTFCFYCTTCDKRL